MAELEEEDLSRGVSGEAWAFEEEVDFSEGVRVGAWALEDDEAPGVEISRISSSEKS